ncbi:MAG: hypothetical protein JOZ96_21480 [Acidobacteria bacterium]|nr:hypothetical protein [Acidobacteriota bacterium]
MRVCVLLLALALFYGYRACGPAKLSDDAPALTGLSAHAPSPSATTPTHVDFNTQVRPLLESKCSPCHFTGGTMYARLPFDRPETIEKLGTKLFTRIRDEKEQRLIRDFLAQQAEKGQDRP